MDIKVGQYHIRSDVYNLWITREYLSKGKVRQREVTGYHRTWTSLIQSFIDRRIKGSDADEVKMLLLEVAKVKREAIELSIEARRKGVKDR